MFMTDPYWFYGGGTLLVTAVGSLFLLYSKWLDCELPWQKRGASRP